MVVNSNNFINEFDSIKNNLQIKIKSFLEQNLSKQLHFLEQKYLQDEAKKISESTLKNIEEWINSEIPSKYKEGLFLAIKEERWSDITETFWKKLNFGTSGIRGKLSGSTIDINCEKDLYQLLNYGTKSDILRGTNTINEVSIYRYAEGLTQYFRKKGMAKLVIGYDNRIMSKTFSQIIAKIFLENGFTVFLFDEINPLPELSFSVTALEVDLGIEITASHNDKRHNGFKLILKSGSPPNLDERNEMAEYILGNLSKSNTMKIFEDNELTNLKSQNTNLLFLGETSNSKSGNNKLIEIHQRYLDQIKNFVFQPHILEKYASQIQIIYSSTYGTGSKIIPKLLNELGYVNVKNIFTLSVPDPLFPLFQLKQILDPSDISSANVTINELIKQYGDVELEKSDIILYSDPDADRLGLIVKVSKEEQKYFGKWKFIKANDIWTLILWYILKNIFNFNSSLNYREKLFIVKSYITSDSLNAVAQKFGIQCLNGSVGFSDLSNIVHEKWKEGKINVGMFEESNGIGIAGNPKIDSNIPSHILEKDAALAATLIAEISAYAKSEKTTILKLLDHLYVDPEIGYYATFRLDLPENGTFEGISAEINKKHIMKHVETIAEKASNQAKTNSPYLISNMPVSSVEKYSTGRYDSLYWPNFPDEGIRFFLNSRINHITIRSSGTESKIRIFVQYKLLDINEENLQERKIFGDMLVKKLAYEVKNILEKIH